MRLVRYLLSNRVLTFALAWVLAGCSTNAGFGTPATNPNPVQPYGPTPVPNVSGSVMPLDERPGMPQPEPAGSLSPTPTPPPNSLTIAGAALRLAYDGSAKDPLKAPRLLELNFALENTTQNAAKIASVAVYSDKAQLGSSPISVSAGPGQTSEVAAVALKTNDDPTKYKELTLNFLDDAKKMIGSTKLDVPSLDASFTSLDEHHPKGPFSIDSLEVAPIETGQGPHFEITFAITNASTNPINVSQFVIRPPKGESAYVTIPMAIPARSVSGFMSFIIPYNGKTLPPGNYSVSAMQNGASAARASAVLL